MPIHKWQIGLLSALREKFNPRNINHMPLEDSEARIGTVKFFVRLDLDQICEGPNWACQFVDGH